MPMFKVYCSYIVNLGYIIKDECDEAVRSICRFYDTVTMRHMNDNSDIDVLP